MARQEQKIYKNSYFQGSMSDAEADCILALLKLEDGVDALKNCIYDLSPDAINYIINEHESYEKVHGSLQGFKDSFDYSTRPLGTLRKEQTVGVAFMYYAKSCLLGDEVGLGKTVETAGLANLVSCELEKQNKPSYFVFLAEKASSEQIRKKLVQFTGKFVGLLPDGEKGTVSAFLKANESGQNYSIVGTHALLNNTEFQIFCLRHPFNLFVVDEGAILKSDSTDIYRNAKALFAKHERKVILNATPLETNLRDFYNQLKLLDSNYMPTVSSFEQDFCRKEFKNGKSVSVGTKNENLFKQAVCLRYLARTRKLLGAKFENNTSTVYIIAQCKAQRELMRKSSLYQQIADYPPAVDIRVEAKLDNIPKARVLLNIIKSLDLSKEKVYVYCNYKQCQAYLLSVLKDQGYTGVIVNGDTKSKQRKEYLDSFTSGAYNVIITNVKRGLDLNNCNHCIIYTVDTNPQKMGQAEGRMTRDFDICFKNLYMLVMQGREEAGLNEVIKARVKMADDTTVVGNSMVMDAIRHQDKRIAIDFDT